MEPFGRVEGSCNTNLPRPGEAPNREIEQTTSCRPRPCGSRTSIRGSAAHVVLGAGDLPGVVSASSPQGTACGRARGHAHGGVSTPEPRNDAGRPPAARVQAAAGARLLSRRPDGATRPGAPSVARRLDVDTWA